MERLESTSESTLIFFVNGKKVVDDNVEPEWTLLRYLREKLRLPGTKLGCAEGGCGACTVMVSRMDRSTGKVKHFSVNACLTPIGALHGLSVTTTEGIGSTKTRLHPVQERLAKSHGSQCGFCTPGFVMSMYTLLRNNPKPTMEEIEESIVGNLCRCTGYRPILEGFRTFSKEANEMNGCGKKDCCQMKISNMHTTENSNGLEQNNGNALEETTVLCDPKMFTPYDPSQEIIFPPELKLSPYVDTQHLILKGSQSTFFRPVNLTQVLQLKKLYPESKIVVGNTEVGVEVKFKNLRYPVVIHPANVPELLQAKIRDSYVEIGAALPLSNIETTFKKWIKELPRFKTKVLKSILEMLRWFAGRQIRNVAALGGNIMTGSPISDLNPIFMAAGASLTFMNVNGEREVPLDENFFTGYRKNIARNDEVLTSVKIPFTNETDFFMAYKQAKRRDDDIAIVNSAMKATIEPESLRVLSITLAFGGMAPTTVMANKTMKELRGSTWNTELLEKATSELVNELRLEPSAPGGMVDYRNILTASFFFKFYLHVCRELNVDATDPSSYKVDEDNLFSPSMSSVASTQFFQNVPKGQEKIDPVGRPIPHLAALKQTSGEATYADDIPFLENELQGVLVTSTRAHAKILQVDYSDALLIEGFSGFISAKHLPGSRNKTGYIIHDEEVFASDQVRCVGQIIGIAVATERSIAERAAKAIKVHYKDLPNPILTIEDAIKANSMWNLLRIEDGDIGSGFKCSDYILEGEMRLGGQEHFYLEPNVDIAIPHEDDEMEVICSTQTLRVAQSTIAKALGVPINRVKCTVRRIGGGFGGKQSRSILPAITVAVAAAVLQRPVRLNLDRDEDMQITGGRNPYLGRWKVGFNKDGTLNALDTQFFVNAGCSLDLSDAILKKSLFNVNGSYKIKNVRVRGQCCRTNLPSNTAFRGFGTPQAMIVMENVIENVANALKMDPVQVKEKNLYGTSVYKCHYGQELSNCTVRQCWDQVIQSGEYHKRKSLVDDFNRKNRLKKRGVSVVPLKFSIGFGPTFLNQGGALVLVYTDGSVLVSHGGVEMGQGIHTKMIQVASRALQIPMENVYISETNTDKVPNASPTAASLGSDVNGMAILDACKKITDRLAPYKAKNLKGSWKDWVSAAYFDRVSLSATGFYKVPNIQELNFDTLEAASPFAYFAYGAGLSEVEIDCLTGDHQVLRTDIVMDGGNSLNPAIDIGQIEGAFLQGYGMVTMEQLLYSPSGALLTKGPGAYKIPSVMDIPREFNVSLLRGSGNPKAIYSSKALGEPPLLAGAAVFFAIREAVKAACGQDNVEIPMHFDSPATAERIRMACKDWITEKVKPRELNGKKPWAIDVSK